MLTLTFNTTTKEVKATNENGTIVSKISNVPTVKPTNDGYYEVIQEVTELEGNKRYPVARFPISNTIMFIEK